jgi:hypothetical protein
MLEKIWIWLKHNLDQIFAWTGRGAAGLLGLYILYQILKFIILLPGFRFDPFSLALGLTAIWQFNRWLQLQYQTMHKQNQILSEIAHRLSENGIKTEQLATQVHKIDIESNPTLKRPAQKAGDKNIE